MSTLDFPLGKLWYENFYPLTVDYLGFSLSEDGASRDILAHLLKAKAVATFHELYFESYDRFRNRNCIIFGAGPSLREDIQLLYPLARKAKSLVIAADGAADALAEAMIAPQIIVSDLDSCSEERIIAASEHNLLVLHAHGDNNDLISKLLPEMGKSILGTTQVESVQNVRNIGGLTDGDRACYFASTLDPRILVIAGMDFGTIEGEFSKDRRKINQDSEGMNNFALEKREMKMRLGRQSLEFLIKQKRDSIRFVNVTSHGQIITGTECLNSENLMKEFSRPFPL